MKQKKKAVRSFKFEKPQNKIWILMMPIPEKPLIVQDEIVAMLLAGYHLKNPEVSLDDK